MQLLISPTSPYARKVRSCIQELQMEGMVKELVVNPLDGPARLTETNALGKVPVLITEQDENVIDSLVICFHLASLCTDPMLYEQMVPTDQASYLDMLNRHALANGIIDAAFNVVMEGRRDNSEQSVFWSDRWSIAIRRSIAVFEDRNPPQTRFDLADLTLAIALSYLSFRLDDGNWLDNAPALAEWSIATQERPSLSSTAPVS